MASNFQTKQVAPGVNLASNVTANQTPGQKFFEKMYGPAEVQLFAKQNPKAFKAIMREMNIFTGFSVNTQKPLGDSINTTTGVLTVAGKGGEFTMPNAAKILTPEQIRAENPLLVINPSICIIGKDGVSISAEFSGDMRQFIKLVENLPTSDGWYVGIDGVPKGAHSNSSDNQAIYLALWSEFGSLWRGVNLDFVNSGRRYLYVGGRMGECGGVLVPSGPSMLDKLKAAEKEIGKPGPALRELFEAVREQERA